MCGLCPHSIGWPPLGHSNHIVRLCLLPLAPAILYCSLLCQRGRKTMAWHVRDQQFSLVVIRQDVVVEIPGYGSYRLVPDCYSELC